MDRPTVLLALADQPLHTALAGELQAAGYEVRHEAGPAPDFALLELPFADMRQAAALREAGTAFAVVAAREDAAQLRHAVDAGALGCFVKPLDVSVIVSSISAWIARAAELRALLHERQSALQALRDSRAIGTAVGVLMERHGLSARQAFDALRRQARDQRTALVRLARAIVDGTDPLQGPPG